MGDRSYALEMAKLLDPKNQYFKSRIISRNDFPNRDTKGLDVLPVPENLALVLDDTEVIWQRNKENLILMEKYCYFSSSCREFGFKNCKSLAELKRDEDEDDGALSTMLRVIKRIHRDFFDKTAESSAAVRDVRLVLKTVKKQVLRGCKIVFSGVFAKNLVPENQRLWKMAEEFGAICSSELDSSVTHVVSTDANTEKSLRAAREDKFLVHPRWVEAAYFLWRRHIEDYFQVPKCSARVVTSKLTVNPMNNTSANSASSSLAKCTAVLQKPGSYLNQ